MLAASTGMRPRRARGPDVRGRVPLEPHATEQRVPEARPSAGPAEDLHDLRHTHATLLLQAGVPVKVVADRLGHADVSITLNVYAHVLPAMDSHAVATFVEHVYGELDVP